MNKYDTNYLNNLKNEIMKMSEIEWINIFNIVKNNNVPFTKNNNGVFINMSDLTEDSIKKINNVIDFYKKITTNNETRQKTIQMINT